MFEPEQPAATPDSTPAPEGATPDPTNAEAGNGLPDELQQPEPDEVEEELEGVKLKGRKEALEKIKAERLMQADYTRKTQEVADQRKSFESEREQFTREREATQQFEQEKFQFWSLQQRAQQLQQVNFAALRQTNPEMAESLRDELAKLSAVLPQMGQALAQKAEARKLETERERANRANQSEQIVMREVKDWGPEKFKAFVDAGGKAGLQPADVQRMLVEFPQVARFLDKALKFDQHLASRLQKPPPPPPPQPATRLAGSGATNTKSPDAMNEREYAEWRRQRRSPNR